MSDGYCEVDFGDVSDDADPVEFWNPQTVTARKDHVCDECRGPIAKGEQYRRTSYKWEGKFDMERMCALCLEAATEFDFRLVGGSLWEMFAEEWDNGARVQSCIARLSSAKAKEHMRQQWLKWQERRHAQRQRLIDLRKQREAGSNGSHGQAG